MSATRVPTRIAWALEQLTLTGRDRLLEIGCGSGLALSALAARRPAPRVVGIDRSSEQCRRARAHNAAAIAAGRIDVKQLALTDAPTTFGSRAFTIVLAINVNEFWTNPEQAFNIAAHLLTPRGRLCLVYESPSAPAARRLTDLLPLYADSSGFVASPPELAKPGGRLLSLIARRGSR